MINSSSIYGNNMNPDGLASINSVIGHHGISLWSSAFTHHFKTVLVLEVSQTSPALILHQKQENKILFYPMKGKGQERFALPKTLKKTQKTSCLSRDQKKTS